MLLLLVVAPGITTWNKELLVTKGIATRSKDACPKNVLVWLRTGPLEPEACVERPYDAHAHAGGDWPQRTDE